ncbi:peptide chain release factor H [Adhaeribacter sp. BT258]|uniref:Peptide chain release factor H n=1 Tax=Adhaeribacter terrigena TaxID=2793070 RepID=A0ABS1C0B3_9BACT|nr:peptide chain release factor H [Adhaeribacter terrigena]MBK0402606.1 peptide chain release factor H [Adhaeribacter terrigena]
MEAYMIQISAGRGPEECCRVVARVLEIFLKEARSQNLAAEVVASVPGNLNGTLLSALVQVKGAGTTAFLQTWTGTIQWIAPSPYRKYHKRKNWFVGLQAFEVARLARWQNQDVQYETLRASGPGGQHVNKTESAVRARHLPSGITVVASERRSQFQNKAEALERLKAKVNLWQVEQAATKAQNQWEQHLSLERGNAVRTFNERL